MGGAKPGYGLGINPWLTRDRCCQSQTGNNHQIIWSGNWERLERSERQALDAHDLRRKGAEQEFVRRSEISSHVEHLSRSTEVQQVDSRQKNEDYTSRVWLVGHGNKDRIGQVGLSSHGSTLGFAERKQQGDSSKDADGSGLPNWSEYAKPGKPIDVLGMCKDGKFKLFKIEVE